jgi:hypothetical protein
MDDGGAPPGTIELPCGNILAYGSTCYSLLTFLPNSLSMPLKGLPANPSPKI